MMAEAPPTAPELDFSLLSTGYGILSTSPAWPEVQAALERLERDPAGAGDPGRATDIALVQEYRRTLVREAATLGRALVLSAAIGVRAEGERPVRVQRGLEALSAGYELKRLPAKEVATLVKRLFNDFAAPYRGLRLARTYTLREPRALAKWSRDVRADIEAVEKAVPKTLDLDGAWNDWGERLPKHFRGEPAPPTLRQLGCAAAASGPGFWLRLELGSMTILQWSSLLRGAIRLNLPPSSGAPPLWAGNAALWALGFPAFDLSVLRRSTKRRAAGRNGEPPPPDWSGLPARLVPDVAALIVAAPEQHGWIPHPAELAAFMITPEHLLDLSKSTPEFLGALAQAAGTTYLAVAVGSDGAEPPMLSRAPRDPLAKLPRVDIYPTRPAKTPTRPFVVAPANPGDLLKGLRVQIETRQEAVR